MFSSKDLFFTPAAGGYTVSKSLRFRLSATAYLNRTFGTPSDNKKFYLACCLKRGSLGSAQTIISSFNGDANNFAQIYFDSANKLVMSSASGGTTGANATTDAVFRDPSSWYLFEFLFDSTLGTAADRTQIWVNGVRQTVTGTTVPSNAIWHGNTAVVNNIGRTPSAANYADFYLAEVNGVDGQSLTLPLCGAYDANGVWQPKAYSGSYGNNGFYLKFTTVGATSGSNTGYGQDFSGNGNYWTTNNFGTTSTATTYDSMLDSPTNATGDIGNYAVINPLNLWQSSGGTSVTNGNLQQVTTTSAATGGAAATIAVSSGKYYWEIEFNGVPFTNACGAGLYDTSVVLGGANSWVRTGHWILGDGGLIYINGAAGTASGTGAFAAGDIARFAFDGDTGKLWVGKNATWVGTPGTSGEVATISMSGKSFAPIVTTYSNTGGITIANFGQRPFAQTVPSGFSALNTQNLTTPTITNGASYMAAVKYDGNGSYPRTISTDSTNSGNNPLGTSFQPDFVWIKARSIAYDNILYDVNRSTGTGASLVSNATSAEGANAVNANMSAFTTSGFTIGSTSSTNILNASTQTFVAWQWKAGGTGVTNTSGSITSTVSANTTAGFSVVTFTAPNSASPQTFGHGLGVAPSMIFIKIRNTTGSWQVYHASIGNTQRLLLNTTDAATTTSGPWNNTSPSSTVVTIGTTFVPDASASTYVAYCFAPVAGYSAFGSYTGNGSATDGPFIFTNMRPRYVLIKSSSSAQDWIIIDTSRNTYNVANSLLLAQSSSAELTYDYIDILSNGFKIRNNFAPINTNGATYIWAAFAENPFKISRAR